MFIWVRFEVFFFLCVCLKVELFICCSSGCDLGSVLNGCGLRFFASVVLCVYVYVLLKWVWFEACLCECGFKSFCVGVV